jgi:hypothetical protein
MSSDQGSSSQERQALGGAATFIEDVPGFMMVSKTPCQLVYISMHGMRCSPAWCLLAWSWGGVGWGAPCSNCNANLPASFMLPS